MQKKKDNELVVYKQMDDMDVMSLEQAVAVAEHNIEIFKRIKTTVLKATRPSDWVKMGETYQITGAGAERIGGLIGVSWSDTIQNKIYSEDEIGKYYIYEYRAKFSFGNRSIIAIGTCSQRDKFFSMKDKKLLPSSEIDETNIMKSAYTNMVMNGVTRILGMRGITAEDLVSAGFRLEDIAQVTFRESGQDSTSTAQKRADIREYLLAKFNGDEKLAKAELIKLTAWKNQEGKEVAGKASIDELSPKQVDILYGKLKDAILEFKRAGQNKQEPAKQEASDAPVLFQGGK